MQIHQFSFGNPKKTKRVGRGGKRGTYSGRGIKGQKARAGAKIRPAEREILKKIPKLRGYKFKSFRSRNVVVNIGELNRRFKTGDVVSPQSLLKMRLVARIKGRLPKVKILGKGELDKKLIFKNLLFSRAVSKKLKNV